MDHFDDADRLRARQAEADVISAADPGVLGRGSNCFVGKVSTASGPAAPGFFKVEVQDVTGAETEGGAGTLTATGRFVIAMNLGGSVPSSGTAVIVTDVNYRFAFRHG